MVALPVSYNFIFGQKSHHLELGVGFTSMIFKEIGLLSSYYTTDQMRRHEVKPGMTGLAQVSGRNNLSWEEKFNLDVQYVENHNILLDFKIMLKTVDVMLKREGINAPNQTVGSSRFTGSESQSGSIVK